MSPRAIGALAAEWRDAAKSTTLQDVYSEESGPYFECAQELEALLREWQAMVEACNDSQFERFFNEGPNIIEKLLGVKESK